jgi:hypothetical protein
MSGADHRVRGQCVYGGMFVGQTPFVLSLGGLIRSDSGCESIRISIKRHSVPAKRQ